MSKPVKPYKWLAKYYDEFFQPLRGPIDKARRKMLRNIMPQVQSACDLGCGAGSTAITLAKAGKTVYAVDLSPAMCRIVRDKAKAAGLAIEVQNSDMRSFVLPEQVDLFTCECDALNHLAKKSDLRPVVRAVAKALKPGGHFFFDVNNSLAFTRYWAGMHWVEKPGVVMIMNNGHNQRADYAWADIDWFIRDDASNSWRRYHEQVEEVCWTEEELEKVFKSCGFAPLECWDAAPYFKDDPRIIPGCRSIYLAQKVQ